MGLAVGLIRGGVGLSTDGSRYRLPKSIEISQQRLQFAYVNDHCWPGVAEENREWIEGIERGRTFRQYCVNRRDHGAEFQDIVGSRRLLAG